MVDPVFSESVIAYVGVAGRLDTRTPEERVVELVGDQGFDLLPRIKAIVDAVYDADPPLHGFRTVMEMGEAVQGWLKTRYPELSATAVKAIANSFTFVWK